MIKIIYNYSWFNIYVDNTLILTHIKNIDAIIKRLHETNTPYNLDFRTFV